MLLHFLIAILLLAPAPRLHEGPGPPRVSTLQLRILEAATLNLEERFPDDASRLEVRLLRTGGRLVAELPVRLKLPDTAALPRAHVQAKVHQIDGGVWQEKGWAMLYISHFDSVAVTTRKLKEDEQLTPADFRFAWIETTKFRGEPLTPENLRRLFRQGSTFADQFLKEERTLREGDVRNALDVTLGQSVTMTYRRDQFVLSFTCKARMPGFTGDEIKLFAPATNKTYRVRITGPGKAEWLETLE